MFCKIALKNVTRSVKDYFVYFITITFGVCLFYVFNSMESQSIMGYLAQGGRAYLVKSIMLLINVLSVFVSVVLAFLILYANTFMIRRRKRELGTYMLLGMRRRSISMLLFLETLCIGLLALGVGLLLGVFLSQFISVFTANLFAIQFDDFHFVFSLDALLKTVLYFSVIFVLVMIFNSFSVTRCKLIDLMQADKTNQDLKMKSLGASVVMFLVGVTLLAVAYAMLLRRGLLQVDLLFWVMLGLGTAGTLLFFRSLSGFLLRICQSSKRIYYRGLNMFILRQFNSKINTTYVSMTAICLMLLLAIGITACCIGLNSSVEAVTIGKAPYDVSLRFWPHEGKGIDLAENLRERGFDPDAELSGYRAYNRCWVRLDEPLTIMWNDIEDPMEKINAISLSDFNAIMELQGAPAITLDGDTYGIVQGTVEEGHGQMSSVVENKPPISIGGTVYTASVVRDEILTTGGSMYDSLVVLPDQLLEGVEIDSQTLVGNYPPGADKEAADARFFEASSGSDFVGAHYEGGYSLYCETKLNNYMETMGSKILILFIGIYLGCIFLLTSAAVLALQQLSQAADNVVRYRVLSRLGAPEKMRDRSIYAQIFLYFFLPLALAVVHSVVGMTAANAVIEEVGHVDSAASSVGTAAAILAVYGAYFLATCWGSRRIVRGR